MATLKITKAMRNTDIIAILTKLSTFQNELDLTPENLPYHSSIEDCISYLNRENELLNKKNKATSKAEKEAADVDAKAKEKILTFLASQDKVGVTATQVQIACDLKSSQKAAYLLNSLVKAEKAQKESLKGRSLFFIHPAIASLFKAEEEEEVVEEAVEEVEEEEEAVEEVEEEEEAVEEVEEVEEEEEDILE